MYCCVAYRQPEFCDWAFNLPRGDSCQAKWDLIPDKVDILLTHGPPLGHGDLLQGGGRSGCVNLLYTIQQRVKPKYHVFGHIHEGKHFDSKPALFAPIDVCKVGIRQIVIFTLGQFDG